MYKYIQISDWKDFLAPRKYRFFCFLRAISLKVVARFALYTDYFCSQANRYSLVPCLHALPDTEFFFFCNPRNFLMLGSTGSLLSVEVLYTYSRIYVYTIYAGLGHWFESRWCYQQLSPVLDGTD